jgi:hypothetical protein
MSKTLRILAWPAFKNHGAYNVLLYGHMQELGATVEEFSAWRVLSRRYDIVHLHWPEYCVNGRGALASLFWSCALFGQFAGFAFAGVESSGQSTICRVTSKNTLSWNDIFGEYLLHL